MKQLNFCVERCSWIGVMEDAKGNQIQETGQEKRPARMVGLLSLESAFTGMEAGFNYRVLGYERGGIDGSRN